MALTLDPILAAAQDNLVRQPIINLTASQVGDAIPFDGQYFNDYTAGESNADLINTSWGSMAMVGVRDNQIIFFYTDTNKTFFSEITISTGQTVESAAICELADGNIGVLYVTTSGDVYALRRMVIGPTGLGVVATGAIEVFDSGDTILHPSVIRLANGNYLATYAWYDSSAAEYYVMTRTSTDFLTWAADSAATLTGLLAARRKGNPSLLQVTDGDVFLFFDYVNAIQAGSELANIYYVLSSDNGVTWAAPVKLTSYTAVGTSGLHPSAIEQDDGDITLAYHEEESVLWANESTDLWAQDCGYATINDGTDLHYDAAHQKLYVLQIYNASGTKTLCGIVKISTDTWTVDKTYTTLTSPEYNAVFKNVHCWPHRHYGDGQYACVGTYNATRAVLVLDGEADTITEYFFNDNATYSIVQNIDISWQKTSHDQYFSIFCSQIDATAKRLYLTFTATNVEPNAVCFGYIDLTEAPDPITGKYTWHQIFYDGELSVPESYGLESVLVLPSQGYVVFPIYSTSGGTNAGRLLVRSLTDGAILKDYKYSTHPAFPFYGVRHPVYNAGKIYATPYYTASYGQSALIGLFEVDLTTDQILYHRPSWATLTNYGLMLKKVTDDNRIIIAASGYGITIYDIDTDTWTLLDNTAVPGLVPNGTTPEFEDVDYDPVNDVIFAGQSGLYWEGVIAVSEGGAFQQGKYMTGTFDTGWSFSAASNLTIGMTDGNVEVSKDLNGTLWAAWVRRDTSEHSFKWDQDSASLSLNSYLVDSNVTRKQELDRPGTLSFELSHGHLWDRSNTLSIINHFLKRGRKVTLQWGETVSGIDYLHNQGTFIVEKISLFYERGEYPTAKVQCSDYKKILNDVNVVASERYDDTAPEELIIDLITTFSVLTAGDISFSTFTDTHDITHQFIDTSVMDAVDELLDHFNNFSFVDVDGILTAREIDLAAATDHSYTDSSKIINFTPDDSFSSFTNRVIVRGEGNEPVEVVYPEEVVGTLSGTGGWWGTEQVERFYYDKNSNKKCRDPRLNILQSVTDAELFMMKGGGEEYISDVDPYELWVEITIQFPDYTEAMIAAIAILIATGVLSIWCSVIWISCGVFLFAITMQISIIIYMLGVIASYSYEIMARPVGEVMQTFQASSDDLELQQELNGEIVEDSFDDPFAYTAAICQTVADNELIKIKAQRNRVSFEKIADMRDELGDIVQFVHPYSGIDIKVFIASLQRTFKKSQKSGYFKDQIEGWRITT